MGRTGPAGNVDVRSAGSAGLSFNFGFSAWILNDKGRQATLETELGAVNLGGGAGLEVDFGWFVSLTGLGEGGCGVGVPCWYATELFIVSAPEDVGRPMDPGFLAPESYAQFYGMRSHSW